MNIILDVAMLEIFYKSMLDGLTDPNAALLHKIFATEKNKFLIKDIELSELEDKLHSVSQLENIHKMMLVQLSDKMMLSGIKMQEYKTDIEMFNDYKDKYDVLFVLANERSLNFSTYTTSHVCFWQNIIFHRTEKHNKCKILFSLMSDNPYTLRYIDFNTNNQIQAVFDLFIKLTHKSKELCIHNRYQDYGFLLDSAITKNFKFNFFTRSFNQNQKSVVKGNLYNKFGKGKTSVLFSSDKKITHQRAIISGSYVLEADHDFAEINRANQNWLITISHDQKLVQEFHEKETRYNA